MATVVLEQTSYVPSDTIQKFIIDESFIFGFQSSSVVSKSSANRKQRPKNLPVDTNEPELHAEIFVFSNVITTAPRDSKSGYERVVQFDCN